MDFPSFPLYLDPPPNWHQIANHGSPQQQLPNPSPRSSHVGDSSIRRGSMVDRARLANIPQPEVGLKCPRCDSTNTKFCYFNNYSLSQPRHFCKACRRYWTRGGSLRSVPVGGGFRRNKKNKTRRSKSPVIGNEAMQLNNNNSNNSSTTNILIDQPQYPHLSFMASMNSLSRYGATNLGLNFNEIQAQGARDIRNDTLLNHQWSDFQNFSLLGDVETPTGLRPLEMSECGWNDTTNSIPRTSSKGTQLPAVNIEETQLLNLLKSSSNLSVNNLDNKSILEQYGNGWTDLSANAHISCNFNH